MDVFNEKLVKLYKKYFVGWVQSKYKITKYANNKSLINNFYCAFILGFTLEFKALTILSNPH